MNLQEFDEQIDVEKRETLLKLRQAAWAAPVLASFALSGLSVSSAWAMLPNSTAS